MSSNIRLKYAIQVRDGNGKILDTIFRVVWCEAIGNFTPVFCNYMGKRHLVESDALDLDDPLRCNRQDHIGRMFIRPRNSEGVVVEKW